ncbi:hypothetical protein Spiaf_1793 [Spirochaeta africana DSM 8902]|uniref:Ig-like domain-containing protein n=1 Tax=Spirochaeta africana (strain ATCC 700263 / DSM 8902 / Z-7692) TaxID=889378 RepID=H9UK07_SPIAZ|nr:hypothetical protein Spiaf_1793 [Spirochaeta africana DSM 8902]
MFPPLLLTLFVCALPLSGWTTLTSRQHSSGDLWYAIQVDHPASRRHVQGSTLYFRGEELAIRARKTEHNWAGTNYYIEAYDEPDGRSRSRFANRSNTSGNTAINRTRTLRHDRHTITVSGWRDRLLKRNRERLGTISFSFVRDNTPPQLNWVGQVPHNGAVLAYPVRLRVAAADGLSGLAEVRHRIYRVDEDGNRQLLHDSSGEDTGPLADGSYHVVFTATDRVSNRSELELSFAVDTLDPVLGYTGTVPFLSDDEYSPWLPLPESGYLLRLDPQDPPRDGYASGVMAWYLRVFRRDAAGGYSEAVAAISDREGEYELRLTEGGDFLVAMQVEDAAGNRHEKAGFFRIDDQPPVITLPWTEPREIRWFHTPPELTADVEDNQSGLDSVAWMLGDELLASDPMVRVTRPGRHELRCVAHDRVGNSSEVMILVGIDYDPPMLGIAGYDKDTMHGDGFSLEPMAAAEAPWNSCSEGLAITWLAEDPVLPGRDPGSGVDPGSWRWRSDDSDWRRFGDEQPILRVLREGVTEAVVQVRDNAGNRQEQTVYLYRDTIGPVLEHIWYEAGNRSGRLAEVVYLQGMIEFHAEFSDAASGVAPDTAQWRVVGAAGDVVAEGSGLWLELETDALEDGSYRVGFRVQDRAGNWSQASWDSVGYRPFAIDTTPPTLGYVDPASALDWSDGRHLRFRVADAGSGVAGVEVRYRGTLLSAELADGLLSTGLPEELETGLHELQIRLYDTLGNTAWLNIPLRIDRTPPRLELLSDTGPDWQPDPARCRVLAVDDESGIADLRYTWYRLQHEGAEGEPAGSPEVQLADGLPASELWQPIAAGSTASGAELQQSASGIYLLVVSAVDQAGNTSLAHRLFRIDREAPDLTLELRNAAGFLLAEHAWIRDYGVVLRGCAIPGLSGVDPESWTAWLSDSETAGEPVGGLLDLDLYPDGVYEISMQVRSRAGAAAQAVSVIRIDRSPPQLCAEVYPWYDHAAGGVWVTQFEASDAISGLAETSGVQIGDGRYPLITPGEDVWSPLRMLLPEAAAWRFAAIPEQALSDGADLLAVGTEVPLVVYTYDHAGNRGELQRVVLYGGKSGSIAGVRLFGQDGAEIPADFGAAMANRVLLVVDPEGWGEPRVPEYPQGGAAVLSLLGLQYRWAAHGQAMDTLQWQWHPAAAGVAADTPLTFELEFPGDGEWLIQLRTVDAAGVAGPVHERVILVDGGLPLVPHVSSSVFPEGMRAEVAVPFSNGWFDLYPGREGFGNSGSVSLPVGFLYQLERGVASSGGFTAIEEIRGASIDAEDGTAQLTLYDLPDSLAGEHYRLQVRAVGRNGLVGPPARYRFVVDTSPPEGLVLFSRSHGEAGRWENCPVIDLSWNRPADAAGVGRYYVRIDCAGPAMDFVLDPEQLAAVCLAEALPAETGTLPAVAEALPVRPDGQWYAVPPVGDWMHLSVQLEDHQPESDRFGVFTAVVVAEDYAGNRSAAWRELLIDRSRPQLVFGTGTDGQTVGQPNGLPESHPDGLPFGVPAGQSDGQQVGVPAGQSGGLEIELLSAESAVRLILPDVSDTWLQDNPELLADAWMSLQRLRSTAVEDTAAPGGTATADGECLDSPDGAAGNCSGRWHLTADGAAQLQRASGLESLQLRLYAARDGVLHPTPRSWDLMSGSGEWDQTAVAGQTSPPGATGADDRPGLRIAGLTEGRVYELRLQLRDRAGNAREITQRFGTGATPLTALRVPWRWERDGVLIQGIYDEQQQVLEEAMLRLPAACKPRYPDGRPLGLLALDSVQLNTGQTEPVMARYTRQPVLIRVGSWDVLAHGITVQPDRGLLLDTAQVILGPDDRTAVFRDVWVTTAPTLRFARSARLEPDMPGYPWAAGFGGPDGAGSPGSVGVPGSRDNTGLRLSQIDGRPGWLIGTPGWLVLEGDAVAMGGTSQLHSELAALQPMNLSVPRILLNPPGGDNSLVMTGPYLDRGWIAADESPYVVMEGVRYALCEVELQSDRLRVYRGNLRLPEGWVPRTPEFRNAEFTIDGQWRGAQGFYLEPVAVYDADGGAVYLDDFRLEQGRLLSDTVRLSFSTEGDGVPEVLLTGVRLTDDGIDWGTDGIQAAPLRMQLHGFPLDLLDISVGYHGDSPVLMAGKAELQGLPPGFPTGSIPMRGLELCLFTGAILAPAAADTVFSLYDQHGQRILACRGLVLDQYGLQISRAEVWPLPEAEAVIFHMIPVEPGGRMQPVTAVGPYATLVLGDTILYPYGWQLEDGQLQLRGGLAVFPAGYAADGSAVFAQAELAATAGPLFFAKRMLEPGMLSGDIPVLMAGHELMLEQALLWCDGVQGRVTLSLPDPFAGTLSFLAARPGPSLHLGTPESSLLLHGYPVAVGTVDLGNSKLTLTDLVVYLDSLAEYPGTEACLVIPELVVFLEQMADAQPSAQPPTQTVLAAKPGLAEQPPLLSASGGGYAPLLRITRLQGRGSVDPRLRLISRNGYRMEVQGVSVDPELGFLFSGRVRLPQSLGSGRLEMPQDSMILTSQGVLTSQHLLFPDEQPQFHYGGIPVTVHAVELLQDRILFHATDVVIPLADLRVALPAFPVLLDSGESDGQLRYLGQGVSLGGNEVELVAAGLTNQGLTAWIRVRLGLLNGIELEFAPAIFHPDGRLSSPAVIPEIEVALPGGGRLVIQRLRLSGAGLEADRMVMASGGALSGQQLAARHVRIGFDGSFMMHPEPGASFELLGCRVYPEKIAVHDNELILQGHLRLAQSLPTGLAGRAAYLHELKLGLDGELKSLDACLAGRSVFSVWGDWRVYTHDLGIRFRSDQDTAPVLHAELVQLLFPAGLIGRGWRPPRVVLQGLQLDLVTGKPEMDSIALHDFRIREHGLELVLRELVFEADGTAGFSGYLQLGHESLPPVLQDVILDLHYLRVDAVGNLHALHGEAVGLTGVLGNGVHLQQGRLGVALQGETVQLTGAGELRLSSPFPDAGIRLDLQDFMLTPSDGQLRRLRALAEMPHLQLGYPPLSLEQASLELSVTEANPGSPELSVAGMAVLPAEFPGSLASARLELQELRYSAAGLLALQAELQLEPGAILAGGIELHHGTARLFGAPDPQLQVSGAAALGNSFPDGLRGMELQLADMTFDVRGNLQSLDCSAAWPLQGLGKWQIQDFLLEAILDDERQPVFGITGMLILPGSIGSGLPEFTAEIESFQIDSRGVIRELRAGADIPETVLFGGVRLSEARIGFSACSGIHSGELLADLEGLILLPSHLPGELGGRSLQIESFLLSSQKGLLECHLALAESLRVPLFAGVEAEITSLRIGSDGLHTAGLLHFAPDFPLDIGSVVLDELHISWDGQLLAVCGGLSHLFAEVGGFSAELHDLAFHADGISIRRLLLELPQPFERGRLELRNAGITAAGEFYGEAQVQSIGFDMAGFRIYFDQPRLNPADRLIGFRSAGIELPALLGGARFEVYGFRISPEGVGYSGGLLALPEFSIGGGLGFREVMVELMLDDGQMRIAGSGEAVVPGIGAFAAQVVFVDRCSMYPWGLQRAFFSYEVFGLGLPIANSGMYLNRLRGGLAYGVPDELPGPVQYLFDSGTRIEAGISMVDQTGGYLIDASVSTWIDITNWGIAVQGEAAVLRGLVRGELLAALTGHGFYGSVIVELVYVRGMVEVFVYTHQGVVRASGAGRVQFGLRRGLLLDKTILGVRVRIPGSNIWLAQVGAEVGMFTNGAEGIRGYADVPLLGETGVFVDRRGRFTLGNVSRYELYRPPPVAASQVSLPRHSSGVPGRFSGMMPLANSATGNDVSPPLDRIVFLVAYPAGNPVIRAISPGGERLQEGHPAVEMIYDDWGAALIVHAPEPGNWQVEVENLQDPLGYAIEAYTVATLPQLRLRVLEHGSILSAEGSVDRPGEVTLYLLENEHATAGRVIASSPVGSGSFRLEVPHEQLPTGVWSVAVGFAASDLPERRRVFPDRVTVTSPPAETLAAVEQFMVVDNRNGSVTLHFRHADQLRTAGYLLRYGRPGAVPREIDLGHLQMITLGGFPAGVPLRFGIAPYSISAAEPGRFLFTDTVLGVETGGQAAPVLALPDVVMLAAGERISLPLPIVAGKGDVRSWGIRILGLEDCLDAVDGPVQCAVATPGLNGHLSSARMLAGNTIPVELVLQAGLDVLPGIYRLGIRVENHDAVDRCVVEHLEIVVHDPQPLLYGCDPTELTGELPSRLTLYGSGLSGALQIVATDSRGDHYELAILSGDQQQRVIEIPTGISAGQLEVRARNRQGVSAAIPVAINRPDYHLQLLANHLYARPGGTAVLHIRAEDRHGYTAMAPVSIVLQDTDVPLTDPVATELAPGKVTRIELPVAPSAVPGRYFLLVSKPAADAVSLPLTILGDEDQDDDDADNNDAPILPVIQAVEPDSVYPGQIITIYGHGLNTIQTLHIADHPHPVQHHCEHRIEVQTTTATAPGRLALLTQDGRHVPGPWIDIRTRGLQLRGPERIQVAAGGSSETRYLLTGYAEPVQLRAELLQTAPEEAELPQTAQSQASATPGTTTRAPDAATAANPTGIELTITPAEAVPNAALQLGVTVPAGTAPGQLIPFRIQVHSSNAAVYSQLYGAIEVRAAIELLDRELPQGMVGAGYRARIQTTGGVDTVTVTHIAGRVPPGLQLMPDGWLTGVPREPGVFRMELELGDSAGSSNQATVVVRITPASWSQANMDESGTRWSPVPAPGTAAIRWRVPADGSGIRTSTSCTAVFGIDGLAVYEHSSGRLLFTHTEPVSRLLEHDGVWLQQLVLPEPVVSARGSDGRELWRRENTRILHLHAGELLAATEKGTLDRVLRIDPSTGQLRGRLAGSWHSEGQYISVSGNQRSEIWRWGRGGLQPVLALPAITAESAPAATQSAAAWELPYLLVSAAAALPGVAGPTGMIAAVDDANLYLICREGRLANTVEHRMHTPTLLAGNGKIYLSSPEETRVYAADGLDLLHTLPFGSYQAIGSGKAFVMPGEQALSVLHTAYLHTLWELELAAEQIVASAGMLLLLSQGELVCIGGGIMPPPRTTLLLDPPQPDGDNGFYRTIPGIRLDAVDPAGRVAATHYRLNSLQGYDRYTGRIELPAGGELQLQYYSIAYDGRRETARLQRLRLDSEPPVITTGVSAIPAGSGVDTVWLARGGSIPIQIDPGASGLAAASLQHEYQGREYTRQISRQHSVHLSGNGTHQLRIEARDHAGNHTVKTQRIGIDDSIPTATAWLHTVADRSWLKLTASCSPSGLAYFEYRLDTGTIRRSDGRIELPSHSNSPIVFRAVNQAGTVGEWQTFPDPGWERSAWIADLQFRVSRDGRQLVRNFDSRVATTGAAAGAILNRYPQLQGADYIRLAAADAGHAIHQELLSFTVLVDADIYILPDSTSRGLYPGFVPVEAGADQPGLLMLSATAGSRIYLSGSGSGSGRPDMVFVQRRHTLRIQSPRPETRAYGGDTLELAAAAAKTDSTLKWTLQLPGKEALTVLQQARGSVQLPFVSRSTAARLQLDQYSPDGRLLSSTGQMLQIETRAGVFLEHPGIHRQLLAGSTQPLVYSVQDWQGNPVPPDMVRWHIGDHAGARVEPIPAAGSFMVPSHTGSFQLQATVDIGNGTVITREFSFYAAASPAAIQLHRDHDGRLIPVTPGQEPWCPESADGSLRIHTGTGRYRLLLEPCSPDAATDSRFCSSSTAGTPSTTPHSTPDNTSHNPHQTPRRPMLLVHGRAYWPGATESGWSLDIQDTAGWLDIRFPDWLPPLQITIEPLMDQSHKEDQ